MQFIHPTYILHTGVSVIVLQPSAVLTSYILGVSVIVLQSSAVLTSYILGVSVIVLQSNAVHTSYIHPTYWGLVS